MLTNIIIRIVIVSLLATASYGANASACKKRNAMKGALVRSCKCAVDGESQHLLYNG